MDADKSTPATPTDPEQAWNCPRPAFEQPWTAADTAFSQLLQWVGEMPTPEESEDE